MYNKILSHKVLANQIYFHNYPEGFAWLAEHDTMEEVKQHNLSQGQKFFDKGTMRFFRSRTQTIPPYGGCIFVTSEQYSSASPRLYTVRAILHDGSIRSLSDFQEYKTYAAAHAAARNFANEIVADLPF